MNVLSIVEKQLNPDEQKAYNSSAIKKFGSKVSINTGEWEDPTEKNFINTLFRIEHNGPEPEPISQTLQENPEAEIIFTSFCPISEKGMDHLKSARIIGSIRGGVQHINIEAATYKGIAVFNTPGRNAHAVSDFTVGLMISECRNIARNHCSLMKKNWQGADKITGYHPDLNEKTIGLVGVGHVGRLVAKKVSGFDMKVIAFDPYVKSSDLEGTGITLVDLETLCKEADFISVHAKATEQNKYMIGKENFDLMKKTAFFINTARASLVDTDALVVALKEGKICGAALDVFDKEPLSVDSSLLDLDNVTLTAHLAGVSSDVVSGSPRLLANEMIDFIKGNGTRGLVNPSVLDNPKLVSWLEKARQELN